MTKWPACGIHPLTPEVRSQIKSSVQITSLSDAVEQLFRNALDADAAHVRIAVDFKKGYCDFWDDGEGIAEKEFEPESFLAQAHCSSRSHRGDHYGRHGQALASIAASSLLCITSRQRGEPAHTMILHHGKRISCGRASAVDTEEVGAHGTQVVLHNLFGNFPVRFNAQALKFNEAGVIEDHFNALKRRLVAYLLPCPSPLTVHLRVIGTKHTFRHKHVDTRLSVPSFSIERIRHALRHISSVSVSDATLWKLSSAKAGATAMRFAVCMNPSPSKHCQFISLGRRPLHNQGLGTVLYEIINEAFDASNFGTVPEPVDRSCFGTSNQSLPFRTRSSLRQKHTKPVDRWPCFYLRINCMASESCETDLRNEGANVSNCGMQQIIELLVLMVNNFLERHVLRPKGKRPDRDMDFQTKNESSDPIAERVRPFDAWPRTRAAFSARIDDVCEGLPFVGQQTLSTRPFDTDVQLLLDDMELDSDLSPLTDPSPKGMDYGPEVMGKQASGVDATSTWTNPKTGRTIRLNDSSFVVPPSTCLPTDDSAEGVCNRLLAPTPARYHVRARRDPKLLVERLKQWPVRAFSSRAEAPIVSIDQRMNSQSMGVGEISTHDEESLCIGDLVNARVLRQVDEKFILVTVRERQDGTSGLLVLIDQHAADERVKVEGFFREICAGSSTILSRPIAVECDEEELTLLERAQMYFAHWGIVYQRSGRCQGGGIRITGLPRLIAKRCCQEPKILINLLRREIWADNQRSFWSPSETNSWLDQMAHCPRDLIEMLNSRACRSAIMFNDVLSLDQCEELLVQLSKCTLPFQCAHGRPSLTILTRLGLSNDGYQQNREDMSFSRAYQDWI